MLLLLFCILIYCSLDKPSLVWFLFILILISCSSVPCTFNSEVGLFVPFFLLEYRLFIEFEGWLLLDFLFLHHSWRLFEFLTWVKVNLRLVSTHNMLILQRTSQHIINIVLANQFKTTLNLTINFVHWLNIKLLPILINILLLLLLLFDFDRFYIVLIRKVLCVWSILWGLLW